MRLTKPKRWTNPSLPQMLQMAVWLLYFNAAIAVLARLGVLGSATPYYLLGLRVFGFDISDTGIVSAPAILLELLAIAAFAYSGAMVASERKLGWQLGIVVAAGAVAIPVALLGLDLFRTDYLISWLFDLALLGLLAHTQTREHVRVWFD